MKYFSQREINDLTHVKISQINDYICKLT
jgi:hypothetical protein